MRFSLRQSNHYLVSAPLQELQFKSWLNHHLCLSLTKTKKYPVKCSLRNDALERILHIQNLYRQVPSQQNKTYYSARKVMKLLVPLKLSTVLPVVVIAPPSSPTAKLLMKLMVLLKLITES